jgi:hypothetical protein
VGKPAEKRLPERTSELGVVFDPFDKVVLVKGIDN